MRALKDGAHDYLAKDQLQKEILQHTVRSVIGKAQLKKQLKKQERQQQLINQIAFQIRQSLKLDKILETAVEEVRQLLQCDRVLAYQFSPDMSGEIIAESVGDGWTTTLGKTVQDTYFQDQGAKAYSQGKQQIVSDVYTASLNPCHLELLEQFEVKAILVVPILIGESPTQSPHKRLWGLMVAHHCAAPRHWQPNEVQMLEALAVHCAIAIHHAELLAQTQAALKKEKALTSFKSQIVATVSHEYNSPLTAIQGAAEILYKHQENLHTPASERLLDIIIRKSKHMSALVSDMLLVHQAEINKIKVRISPLELGPFLDKIIHEQQLTTTQHPISLQLRGDISGFNGDRGLLKLVFTNLLSNAIKYSPEGGKIKIQLVGEPTQVICHVKDSGIGISDKDQKRLFQSFSRGHNVGAITGTGLGLHIVKTAVELHHGTVGLSSREGEGTQVTVKLPKAPANKSKRTR